MKRDTNDKYHSSGLLSSLVSFWWKEGRRGIRGRWRRRIFRQLGLPCGNERFQEGRLILSRDLVINNSLSKRGPSLRIRSRIKPLNNSSSEYSSLSILSAIIHSVNIFRPLTYQPHRRSQFPNIWRPIGPFVHSKHTIPRSKSHDTRLVVAILVSPINQPHQFTHQFLTEQIFRQHVSHDSRNRIEGY